MKTQHANRLRRVDDTDRERVWLWRNHPAVRAYMFNTKEIPWADHMVWFERAIADKHKHALVFECDGYPSGFASIQESPQGTVAEWGFYKAPDAPGGTGIKLGASVLQYAFGYLKLHKIYAQVLGFNKRSIEMHAALGFAQEGVLREQHFDGCAHHDIYCFGMRRAEWERAPQHTGSK